MTRDELLSLLAEYARETDTEGAHADADAALIAYIGDPEIDAAYRAIDKWYA